MPRELIPIVFFNVIAVIGIAFSPIGRAIARRIGGKDNDESASLQGELDDLRAEVDQLRSRVAEVDSLHERMDFAERMIAQGRDKPALPGPR